MKKEKRKEDRNAESCNHIPSNYLVKNVDNIYLDNNYGRQ